MTPDLDRRSTVEAVLELAALDKRGWLHALQRILVVDGRALGVDRVSYWKLCANPGMISCELGYVRSANAFEEGAVLLASDAPPYMDELQHAKVIAIEDVTTNPLTHDLLEYCRARKISSMLDVPVWVESRLVGVLCHEHVGPSRRWGASEIDFVLTIAQVVATALEARLRTHAEEDARRASLLAHASLLMARSLDERVIAQRAVAAVLPLLADWAAIDLFDEGTVERLAIQHADPLKQNVMAEYAATYPPTPDAPHVTVQAHRVGQSVVIPEVTDEALRTYGFSEEHIQKMHGLGLRSAMAVMVRVPGCIDAVMMFVSAERRYDYSALKFAEDFGERVAVALNNARLYRKTKEALRARDEFLTLAAHELRTPFTSLRIACERLLAESEDSPNPGIVTSGQRILRQSRRLTRLVNRMLDASVAERRVPLLQPQEVDLAPLVREVVDELRTATKRTAIDLTLPPAPVVGRWDGDRLQEVVGNLVDNAVKYGGGQPIRVTLAVEGDDAVLSVADRGIGIDPKIVPRLFEPYARGVSSKGYGGLGLGLFISREIVVAHGGSIDVRSEVGVGSEFRVRLPGVVTTRTG